MDYKQQEYIIRQRMTGDLDKFLKWIKNNPEIIDEMHGGAQYEREIIDRFFACNNYASVNTVSAVMDIVTEMVNKEDNSEKLFLDVVRNVSVIDPKNAVKEAKNAVKEYKKEFPLKVRDY